MDIDSKSTPHRTAIKNLYSKSKIIPTTGDFGCRNLFECSQLFNRKGAKLDTGNWAYVGVNYGNALINIKPAKVLVISMDRGGEGVGNKQTFSETQEDFRTSTEYPENAHMGGVSAIICELVDDYSPTIYSGQYALTNAVKCSEHTGKRSDRSSKIQTRNCSEHLLAEINSLDPDIIISQGKHPNNTIKSLFDLRKPIQRYKNDDDSQRAELFKVKNKMILTSEHPARKRGWKWSQRIIPRYMKNALKRIRIEFKS